VVSKKSHFNSSTYTAGAYTKGNSQDHLSVQWKASHPNGGLHD